MSIIICAIYKNQEFYIASDLRAIRNGVVYDNYIKIFEIRPRLYFGMTGIAEEGLAVLDQIKQLTNIPSAELVSVIDVIFSPKPFNLTIMLAGQNEAGDFFIWQKNNYGETTCVKGNHNNIGYAISTTDRKNEIAQFFETYIEANMPLDLSINKTIDFASTIEPTISPTYKIWKLSKADG